MSNPKPTSVIAQKELKRFALNINNPKKLHGPVFVLTLFAVAAMVFSQTALFIGFKISFAGREASASLTTQIGVSKMGHRGYLQVESVPLDAEFGIFESGEVGLERVALGSGRQDFGLPEGQYWVKFMPIPEHTTPDPQSAIVLAGQTALVKGEYKPF
jgi:hypothetical protein